MNPCEGCAYTKGAEANLEPQNSLRGQLCVLGGLPFYCHHAKDGSLQQYGDVTPDRCRELIQSGLMVICQGWKREMAKLGSRGYFRERRGTKRAFAMLGLGALQIFLTADEGPEKENAARTLKQVILELNKLRGFTEVSE